MFKKHCKSFCHSPPQPYFCAGEMAERSNAAVLKTVDSKGPGVRIPLSPPETIVKDVQSLQIIDLQAFSFFDIVNLRQAHFKSSWVIHD